MRGLNSRIAPEKILVQIVDKRPVTYEVTTYEVTGAPRKPEGGHKRTSSKGRPLTIHDNSRSREGRMALRPTRSKSHRREESVAYSKSVPHSEDLLDKKRQEIEEYARLIKKQEHEIRELERIKEHPEDSGLSWRNYRGDGNAMVKYRKAASRGRRNKSRSPTPRRHKASPRKGGRRSKSRTPERRRASSRRSRSRSPSSEEERTRKHHRDRYERPDFDWEKTRPNKTKGQEDETMTA
ncbi:uncharacterized protein LOC131306794 [Rhododendron vialii]|uniref:uncharacterized protein LOC131306794 n=1 Tax=Rhododendron vialii TaxID=182163 RepID=UPI00265F44DB|nr:uncharacterized protein LOC131306794 [Rhododendron vialii]